MPTIATARHWATQKLQQIGIDTAVLDARVLVAWALEKPVTWLYSHPEHSLSNLEWQAIQHTIDARLNHKPVARIVGEREFWGMTFQVTAATLDPRADSETVVSATLHHWPANGQRILDLGTGTGCLLISLLRERSYAVGLGIDQSSDAVSVARANALALGVQDRCHILPLNWENPSDINTLRECATFDVIISNPPYIPSQVIDQLAPEVKLYDPHTALDGGPDGLHAYRSIAQLLGSTPLLSDSGIVVVEVGVDQAPHVAAIFEVHGFCLEAVHEDLQGIQRALVFHKKNL
jgi:release factor glutamine methyltransferase